MEAGASQGLEGFLAALFFGALSVWFHAVNQFNRSTYDQSKEFYRLLDKLRPSDLRKGDVYRQAFLFYAVILTFIYLAVVALLTVPALQQFADLIPGLDTLGGSVGAQKLPEPDYEAGVAFDEGSGFGPLGGVDPGAGLNPAIPLAVSLAVVGLAPNVPGLHRLEEFVRATAHRLSGIPTHLVRSALDLRYSNLIPATPAAQGSAQGDADAPAGGGVEGPELQPADWARLKAYRDAVPGRVENADRFMADVTTILILRRWILEQALFSPYLPISTRYRLAETDVRQRVATLMSDLDRASNYSPSGPSSATAGATPVSPDWPSLFAAAEDTVEDVCLLVVLYEEHHALQLTSHATGENGQDAARRQLVNRFLVSMSKVMEKANVDNVASGLFSRLTLAILGVTLLFGVVFGATNKLDEMEIGGQGLGLAKFALIITLSAVVTYVPALFFTLTFQQSRYVSVPPSWENRFMDGAKPSRYLPQLLACLIIAVFVAFVFRMTYHLYFLVSQVGIERVRENLWPIVDYALRAEFVFALQGGVAACAVVLMIDAFRAGKLADRSWTFVIGLPCLLALMAGIGWVRLYTLGDPWTIFAQLTEAVAPAALIGLVLALYVNGVLRDEFPAIYEKGLGPMPGQ